VLEAIGAAVAPTLAASVNAAWDVGGAACAERFNFVTRAAAIRTSLKLQTDQMLCKSARVELKSRVLPFELGRTSRYRC